MNLMAISLVIFKTVSSETGWVFPCPVELSFRGCGIAAPGVFVKKNSLCRWKKANSSRNGRGVFRSGKTDQALPGEKRSLRQLGQFLHIYFAGIGHEIFAFDIASFHGDKEIVADDDIDGSRCFLIVDNGFLAVDQFELSGR